MKLIEEHIEDIKLLCQEKRVKELYVFGSILTPNFTADSDVDMVVEFMPMDPLEYVDYYYDLKFGLEEMLDKEVDLLELQAIRNPIFKEALNQTKKCFMTKEVQSWLIDILNFIEKIESFLPNERHFKTFQSDFKKNEQLNETLK